MAITLTQQFPIQNICYCHLLGHECPADCKHTHEACSKRQDRILSTLTDDDKLIIEAVIGETEEFDNGTQAKEILCDVLADRARVAFSIHDNKLYPGIVYNEGGWA